MKLRFINPNLFFLILILKQANEILNISNINQVNLSNNNSKKVKFFHFTFQQISTDNLIKIGSKEILNINFSTKLKEAENRLYDNLLDFEDNVIYYLKIRLTQKKI